MLLILPTIAGLTKTKISAGYKSDGADESSILLGINKKTSKDIYWYYNNKPLPGKEENISPTLAMRSGKWKLLMEPDGTNKQLYNIDADHRESKNLIDDEQKISEQLTAKLQSWYLKTVQKN